MHQERLLKIFAAVPSAEKYMRIVLAMEAGDGSEHFKTKPSVSWRRLATSSRRSWPPIIHLVLLKRSIANSFNTQWAFPTALEEMWCGTSSARHQQCVHDGWRCGHILACSVLQYRHFLRFLRLCSCYQDHRRQDLQLSREWPHGHWQLTRLPRLANSAQSVETFTFHPSRRSSVITCLLTSMWYWGPCRCRTGSSRYSTVTCPRSWQGRKSRIYLRGGGLRILFMRQSCGGLWQVFHRIFYVEINLDQLFGVGALAHRGLHSFQGACAGIIPRTAPP